MGVMFATPDSKRNHKTASTEYLKLITWTPSKFRFADPRIHTTDEEIVETGDFSWRTCSKKKTKTIYLNDGKVKAIVFCDQMV